MGFSGCNLHIVANNFKNDSRVLKETKSIAESGIFQKVYIAALWESGVDELEQLDPKREVWRVPLKTRWFSKVLFVQALKYLEWAARIFLRYRNRKIRVVHCHDLFPLPIGLFFKFFTRAKVVYDAHELESERDGQGRALKALSRIVERASLRFADSFIVVSESIGNWYRAAYRMEESRQVNVVKNVPYVQKIDDTAEKLLRKKFGMKDGELLFLYQGALTGGNGIYALLEVFKDEDQKKHIAFMGYGHLEQTIREYESKYPNIHFHPAAKPDEIISYTAGADVGISLPENTCLSYYFCLPNKLFEYLMSGLPVIVSDFPEMAAFIDQNGCGWKSDATPAAFRAVLAEINAEAVREKSAKARACRYNYGWHLEEKTLLASYNLLDLH
jgi:glycosyltransferase involved in cell wall biosynthesis